MCLEKGQKFWKSQGKIREFHQEQNVETMLPPMKDIVIEVAYFEMDKNGFEIDM